MSKNLAREFDEYDDEGETEFISQETAPKVRKMRERDDTDSRKKPKRQFKRSDDDRE